MALAVVAAGISWWQTDLATRQTILSASGRLAGWFAVVVTFPWASFWLIGWVARCESNLVGGVFVVSITAVEAVVLAWLFNWSVHGPTAWVLLAAGVLAAGVYNLFSSDWIAEKVE